MQTLFDSLCQCLGSSPSLRQDGSDPDTIRSPLAATPGRSSQAPSTDKNKTSPATRRTSRLELKDKQWDALFDSVAPTMNQQLQHTHRHGGSPPSSPDASPSGNRSRNASDSGVNNTLHLENAHVLAKAKQAANPSRYHMNAARESPPATRAAWAGTKSHKRKRPICSRDDIFRTRKMGPAVQRNSCNEGNCMNPISKFLSNHHGFANALCFATPVRDEDEEEEDLNEDDRHDNNSLASEANTLNTCEDSMLLLDHKLSQMSQNLPPMPLFHDFKVPQNEPEGLRRIVDAETHSSANVMMMWRQRQEAPATQTEAERSSSSSSNGSGGGDSRGRARVRVAPPDAIPVDEQLPSMKASSTSSSNSSRSLQAGEI
jgi:hypothetical protein